MLMHSYPSDWTDFVVIRSPSQYPFKPFTKSALTNSCPTRACRRAIARAARPVRQKAAPMLRGLRLHGPGRRPEEQRNQARLPQRDRRLHQRDARLPARARLPGNNQPRLVQHLPLPAGSHRELGDRPGRGRGAHVRGELAPPANRLRVLLALSGEPRVPALHRQEIH